MKPIERTGQAPSPRESNPSPQEMGVLVDLFNKRRYIEAESMAKVMTEHFPRHGFAWKVLGAVVSQMGRDAESLIYKKKAATLSPNDAEAHCNLGNALKSLGQLDDAVASFARALEIKPDFAEAYCNLGNTLRELGRLDEAVANARSALAIKPGLAEAHSNLGNALQALGQLDDALASCRQATSIKPDFAEAHNNLGGVLKDLGQIDGAAQCFRRALEIKPDYAEAHSNLGNALKDLGEFGDAVASCRRALEIKPDFAEALNNLGNALRHLGQLDDAVANCRRALAIKPDLAEAHLNLGNALQELGHIADAIACFGRALEIKPDFAKAHNNLGVALGNLGRLDDAVACYRRALEIKPDYAEAHSNLGCVLTDLGQLDDAVASSKRALEIKPDFAEAHSNLLFIQNYLPDQTGEVLLAEARRFGDRVARDAAPYTGWNNVVDSGRYLRVGIVSGDLHSHPVGYFIEGVLAALAGNPECRLRFIAYSNHIYADSLTQRIKKCCRGWHTVVGMSDQSLGQLIREDSIDILIDLSGHTGHNRLPTFARRPAPVQVSWLGYFATTGVVAIDYLIADPWVLPETEEAHFTETIWRLPETRLCFTPPDIEVEVSPLPVLANGYLTFGCLNNLSKVNVDVVALWARVLASVPDSRLLLKAKQFKDASARSKTIEDFSVHGISADRLILEGHEPRAQYLAAYHRIDIVLDTFPYPGGTTSVEGLWMGVPVLTLAGRSFLARQGVGILMNAGLPEWVAADADDYVVRATLHAGDLQRLATLRQGLREQVLASPIFDAPRFATHFESALREMWIRWCSRQQGQPL